MNSRLRYFKRPLPGKQRYSGATQSAQPNEYRREDGRYFVEACVVSFPTGPAAKGHEAKRAGVRWTKAAKEGGPNDRDTGERGNAGRRGHATFAGFSGTARKNRKKGEE